MTVQPITYPKAYKFVFHFQIWKGDKKTKARKESTGLTSYGEEGEILDVPFPNAIVYPEHQQQTNKAT